MSRTEIVELTVLCLITDGDRILLQNRRKNDWQGDTLPVSHMEHKKYSILAPQDEFDRFIDLLRDSLSGLSREESQAPRIIKSSAAANKIPGISRKISRDRITPMNGAAA